MEAKAEGSVGVAQRNTWLKVIEGDAPILLIAPHGGRAGPAARAAIHPKVNDLYTSEITGELARRLGANALINGGMDRNQLDCNRIGELADAAPWLLEMIAERIARIISSGRRAVVLLIHGWNIIEPRVDLGVGLRAHGLELHPAGKAFVSASDDFINRTLAPLAEGLTRAGIAASFGQRYPGGGSQNLLQAFSERHLQSPSAALSRLARFAADRTLEAVQLELSVAVRWPGELRAHCLDIIADSFSRPHRRERVGDRYTVVRSTEPRAASARPRAAPNLTPSRFGLEFCDSARRIGVMASIDLGSGHGGGRVMVLTRSGVLLCTVEGAVRVDAAELGLGPIGFRACGSAIGLEFHGPAIFVPDPTSYVSIERALASGSLTQRLEVDVRLELDPWVGISADGLSWLGSDGSAAPRTAFGELRGEVRVDGDCHEIVGVGRAGSAPSGVGSAAFNSRRTLWARFPDHPDLEALEARAIDRGSGDMQLSGRIFDNKGVATSSLECLELEMSAPEAPPEGLAVTLRMAGGQVERVAGEIKNFVLLSRPGGGKSRIRTCLGFAGFRLHGYQGAGMFECSQRTEV